MTTDNGLKKPAIIIYRPPIIQNEYKRRSVLTTKNADVAQTSVGVTYLRFMNCVGKTGNVLYMFTTNKFEHGKTKTQHLHFIVWSKPNADLYETRSCRHQTMKYTICDLFCVRKYASGEHIHFVSDLCLKTYFSHLAL